MNVLEMERVKMQMLEAEPKEATLENYRNLAVSIAKKYARLERQDVESSDALADAMSALWSATLSFDPDRGVKFITYAHHAILNAVRRGYRFRRGMKVVDGRYVAVFSGSDTMPDRCEEDQELVRVQEHDETSFDFSKVSCHFESLCEKDWQVINLRLQGLTLQVIGDQMGITKERARQIYQRALSDLRFKMKITPTKERPPRYVPKAIESRQVVVRPERSASSWLLGIQRALRREMKKHDAARLMFYKVGVMASARRKEEEAFGGNVIEVQGG
jgi:RNA polymerase sigma factor (sigma-70 family)